ncbi:hypothetical protein AAIB33_18510 [Microbacterium sp. AZCO]|uniref:hypothetical protein n=1 Tax=Microbacterium sp. AZCO TaxID=3142976 RepID=UPI0031F4544C
MSKTTTHQRRRDEAVDPSQQPGYAPDRRYRAEEDFRRVAGKGYIPVRSYQIPADRHE